MRIARAAVLGLLTAATAACGGCAGPQRTARLDAARADFAAEVRDAALMMIDFDLITTRKLTPREKEQQEATAVNGFNPACVKPYTEKLTAKVEAAAADGIASRSLLPLDPLTKYARTLDKEFDQCLHKFGATGFNFVKRDDGREQRIPEYLDEMISSLRAYGAAYAGAAANQNAATAVMEALTTALATGATGNSNYHSVRGHTTKNGTYVAPHYQTNPNDTKSDNWSTKGNVNPITGQPGTKNP
jgi:hypothetical protein